MSLRDQLKSPTSFQETQQSGVSRQKTVPSEQCSLPVFWPKFQTAGLRMSGGISRQLSTWLCGLVTSDMVNDVTGSDPCFQYWFHPQIKAGCSFFFLLKLCGFWFFYFFSLLSWLGHSGQCWEMMKADRLALFQNLVGWGKLVVDYS